VICIKVEALPVMKNPNILKISAFRFDTNRKINTTSSSGAGAFEAGETKVFY